MLEWVSNHCFWFCRCVSLSREAASWSVIALVPVSRPLKSAFSKRALLSIEKFSRAPVSGARETAYLLLLPPVLAGRGAITPHYGNRTGILPKIFFLCTQEAAVITRHT